MAVTASSNHELFDSLHKQVDQKKLEEQTKTVIERENAQSVNYQEQMKDLIATNSTLSVAISSVQFHGGTHTRRSFLARILGPLVSNQKKIPMTLSQALREVGDIVDKLSRFGIYRPGILTFIDRHENTDTKLMPTHIDIYLKAQERGLLSFKTGTDLGNFEGSAYGNLTWRNIFGGAESLNLNASAGTRTRSAYQATFDCPVLSDPDKQISIDYLRSSTLKPWASHEESNQGGGARYSWVSKDGARHQIGYRGVWRQVTGLSSEASPTIRHEAGDSAKSSITHTWVLNRLDNSLMPTHGFALKSISEIAGWGPLQGDVAFCKSEVESTFAFPLQIPRLKTSSGVSFTTGVRAGMLYPLPLGFGGEVQPSRINDRFQLGGPTDVRGFKISGLGPRDGYDSVGGDIYAAGSANLLFPVPLIGKNKPIRFQIFTNAGRLLALSGDMDKVNKNTNSQGNILATFAKLGDGLPSLAAGVGLVYTHPVARFELNFCLPFILRRGEEGRKGLQFGIGINFL